MTTKKEFQDLQASLQWLGSQLEAYGKNYNPKLKDQKAKQVQAFITNLQKQRQAVRQSAKTKTDDYVLARIDDELGILGRVLEILSQKVVPEDEQIELSAQADSLRYLASQEILPRVKNLSLT